MQQCMNNMLFLYIFNTFTSKLLQHFFFIIRTCYYDSYKLLFKKTNILVKKNI